MLHDIMLFAIKSLEKLEYKKAERKEMKNGKISCNTVLKDLSNWGMRNF